MKQSLLLFLALTAVAFAAPTNTAQPAAAARKTAGALSAERLTRVDHLLKDYVEQNKIAGAVALVLRDGKPVYERAIGWSDKEAGRKMTANTIFRIASQTKRSPARPFWRLWKRARSA